MNIPLVIVGVGSLVVGALLTAFPKFIGVRFNRINRSVWERHQDDLPGQIKREIGNTFPAFTPDFDDAKAPAKFRILGIIF
jgi:hypothetical protein